MRMNETFSVIFKHRAFKKYKLMFQRAEQLTPYPQPRFYDPLSSRTFDRSQDKSRSNSKRFHFGNHNHHNHGNHFWRENSNFQIIFSIFFIQL